MRISAWDVTRAIPGCAVTGEAAGTAAALACKESGRLAIPSIETLQHTLRERKAIIDRRLVEQGA